MNAPLKESPASVDELLQKAEWFEHTRAVKVGQIQKEQWIKELIELAANEPERDMWYITSGDCLILVTKTETGNFEVMDLKPYRSTFLEVETECTCPSNVLLQSGCQC